MSPARVTISSPVKSEDDFRTLLSCPYFASSINASFAHTCRSCFGCVSSWRRNVVLHGGRCNVDVNTVACVNTSQLGLRDAARVCSSCFAQHLGAVFCVPFLNWVVLGRRPRTCIEKRCQRTSYPTSLMCVTVALSGARGMDLHARHPSIARKPRNSNTVSDWAAGGTCNKCRRRGERETGDKCFELLHQFLLARASLLVRCGTYVTPDLLWYSCVVSGFSMALAVSPVLWTR